MEQRYPPIADYALLADCHSAALVSRTGCIDWACLRRFDAPSAFGRILDWDRGGTFTLTPRSDARYSRRYLGDSLVLETTVTTPDGEVRILDAFAMRSGGQSAPLDQLLRVVEGVSGEVTLDVHIEPRFDYGELRPWLHRIGPGDYTAVGGNQALVLSGDVDVDVDRELIALTGSFTVRAGQRRHFSVQAQVPHLLQPVICSSADISGRLDETIAWWERWSSRAVAGGPYEPHVRRSAVVLKGLTCAPTGALIAAPTTSLPEELGGQRNWDYRYTWIRDSTLAIAALFLTGHPEVARGFRDFLIRTTAGAPEDLQIMYGIYGERHLPEFTLDLEGYRGSRPVRVGNGAASQRQLDVYGHILDAAHLFRDQVDGVTDEEWQFLSKLVNQAASVWHLPDHGLWEIRGQPRHFVQSKVMLWVALDRGIRLATDLDIDEPALDRWRHVREDIRAAVDAEGVDRRRGCFVQSFGSTEMDAALLLLPTLGFVDVTDPRMVATVEAVREDLAVAPRGFIRRYRPQQYDDGLPGEEATFLMCSFWMVDVLAMQGRLDEATLLFESVVAVGNDLGLYAEEYDPIGDELLGNYPQAFTHMALINSAHHLALAQQRGAGRCATWEECREVGSGWALA